MIGVLYVPPTAPRLLMVNVPPRRSSIAKLAPAAPGQRGQGRAISAMLRRSASRTPAPPGLRGVDRHAEIDVLLVDDLLFLLVDRGVQRRVPPQGQATAFITKGIASASRSRSEIPGWRAGGANRFEIGHVGVVEIRDARASSPRT